MAKPNPAHKDDSFKAFILDQLEPLNGLTCRAMFGGFGLYAENKCFFGIIHRGQLYFKTDGKTRADYIEMEMTPFRPNKKQTLKNYYEVPVEIIEDQEVLFIWASKAIVCRTAK